MNYSEWRLAQYGDLLGRAGIVAFFTFAVVIKFNGVRASWLALWEGNEHPGLLHLVSGISNLVFLIMIVMVTFFRLKPLGSQEGFEPRLTALAGTFAMILLSLMSPSIQIPPVVVTLAVTLLLIGFSLSALVMVWLGRSFSIMPEARKLVTGGPYAVIRHPLYVAEEIAVLGALLLNLSIWSILLTVCHWLLQLRRMHHEEQVLGASFPEYARYAAGTPKYLPRLSYMLGQKKGT